MKFFSFFFIPSVFKYFASTGKVKVKKSPVQGLVSPIDSKLATPVTAPGRPKKHVSSRKKSKALDEVTAGRGTNAGAHQRKASPKVSPTGSVYSESRATSKRKPFFIRAKKLKRFRQKIRRLFWDKTRLTRRYGRLALATITRPIRLRFKRFPIPTFFLNARSRRLYKFYKQKRYARAGKRPPRRRYPNKYTQLRARFPHFFLKFALRSHAFGRVLQSKFKKRATKKVQRATKKVQRATKKARFFSYAFRRNLLTYGLGIHSLRQYFKYPRPIRLSAFVKKRGTIGRSFKRRAFRQQIKLPTTFARLPLRRRKGASAYFPASRYKRHRAYLTSIARKERRNFLTHPPIGISTRVTRFYKRRYGSLLPFFVRKFRFKKLRRYVRLRRRKNLLTPILPGRYRRRRLYPVLPPAFLSRGFSYVFIKQTTNNVFYSVFSRKRRLLANFSNGRTEFTGSKRISTVASEAAAKVLVSYFAANRITSIFFIFGSRFNHFMRAALKIFRSRQIRIAGFKYRMRKPHSLGLRLRSSRRV